MHYIWRRAQNGFSRTCNTKYHQECNLLSLAKNHQSVTNSYCTLFILIILDAAGICVKVFTCFPRFSQQDPEERGVYFTLYSEFCCSHQSKQTVPAKCQGAPRRVPDSAPWTVVSVLVLCSVFLMLFQKIEKQTCFFFLSKCHLIFYHQPKKEVWEIV